MRARLPCRQTAIEGSRRGETRGARPGFKARRHRRADPRRVHRRQLGSAGGRSSGFPLGRRGLLRARPLARRGQGLLPALDAGLDWLGSRARPDDVVTASMPQWVYLRTGLKTIMPPFVADPARAQALLDSVPVRFVVVDGAAVDFTREYTLPLVESSRDRWVFVYSNPWESLRT